MNEEIVGVVMPQEMHKDNKIIAHFKRNKWRYIAIGCAIGGVVIGYFISERFVSRAVINNSGKIEGNVINNSGTIIQTFLERRGHPGNVTRCIETGETFASQNRCAQLLGLDPVSLSKHLNGFKEHVNGLHFEILGEAGLPVA